ncbi:MAG: lysylphosphatidylglycerol synthase transmembrane domain-containing protein [Candidatus Saccharimonadales bacterium]
MKTSKLKMVINLVTLLLLGATIYSLRSNILETLRNIKNADYFILAIIPFLQYWNYRSTGNLYRSIYKIFGVDISQNQSLKLALELNFVGFVLPTAGVSVISYLAVRMREKAKASISTSVITTKIMIQNLSFVIFLFGGLFVLSAYGKASNLLILVSSSLSLMILFGGAIFIYIISSKARIRSSTKWLIDLVNLFFTKLKQAKNNLAAKLSSKKVEKKVNDVLDSEKIVTRLSTVHDNYLILKRSRRHLKKPFIYGLLANLTELATIYLVFAAIGYIVNPGAIIISYAVASFSGIFSIMPGGVGIYEGLMVAVMVSAGVPAGVSLSGIVMYRIINTALSLPAGYYYYHKRLNADSLLKLNPKNKK